MLVVVRRRLIRLARGQGLLPAQPDRHAHQHVHHQQPLALQLRIGPADVGDGHQRLDRELAVLGRLDLVEQILDLQRKAPLRRRHVGARHAAVDAVAAVELVADDEAREMPQHLPDAGIEILRQPGDDALHFPPRQPAADALVQHRIGRGREMHRRQPCRAAGAIAADAAVQRLQAQQVAVHVLLVRDDLAQAGQDGVRAQAEQEIEGLGLRQFMLAGQPAGDQQDQVPGAQRQRALEQRRLRLDQHAQQQHDLLQQHPRPRVVAAVAADALVDLGAAHRPADHRAFTVGPADRHALLAHDDLRHRLFERIVVQPQHAGRAADQPPFAAMAGAGMEVQHHLSDRTPPVGAPLRATPPHQQAEDLDLLVRIAAAVQPVQQHLGIGLVLQRRRPGGGQRPGRALLPAQVRRQAGVRGGRQLGRGGPGGGVEPVHRRGAGPRQQRGQRPDLDPGRVVAPEFLQEIQQHLGAVRRQHGLADQQQQQRLALLVAHLPVAAQRGDLGADLVHQQPVVQRQVEALAAVEGRQEDDRLRLAARGGRQREHLAGDEAVQPLDRPARQAQAIHPTQLGQRQRQVVGIAHLQRLDLLGRLAGDAV